MMNLTPIQRAAFVAEYHRQRENLLLQFPELAEDQQALEDTLEGATFAVDIIADLIRAAREDEVYVTALSLMIREVSDRKARFENRASRRRQTAQHLMDAIGLRKLEQPDFTAHIRATPPRVEIDADMPPLPDSLCRITRTPDLPKIKEALANGHVAGARMTNGGETLTVRVK